jgi:hypothetical protein
MEKTFKQSIHPECARQNGQKPLTRGENQDGEVKTGERAPGGAGKTERQLRCLKIAGANYAPDYRQ